MKRRISKESPATRKKIDFNLDSQFEKKVETKVRRNIFGRKPGIDITFSLLDKQ